MLQWGQIQKRQTFGTHRLKFLTTPLLKGAAALLSRMNVYNRVQSSPQRYYLLLQLKGLQNCHWSKLEVKKKLLLVPIPPRIYLITISIANKMITIQQNRNFKGFSRKGNSYVKSGLDLVLQTKNRNLSFQRSYSYWKFAIWITIRASLLLNA